MPAALIALAAAPTLMRAIAAYKCYILCYILCVSPRVTPVPTQTTKAKGKKGKDELSDYEKARAATMAHNADVLEKLDKLVINHVVHVPHSAFPNEPMPEGGFWVGKLCRTAAGGNGDIGIHIKGEEIFTRSRVEVVSWLPEEQPDEAA